MIILCNYSKLGSYILIDNNTYSIIETEGSHRSRQGIGGISEDGQVVGNYVKDHKLFFFYNGQSFESAVHDLKCTNKYISDLERSFHVSIRG